MGTAGSSGLTWAPRFCILYGCSHPQEVPMIKDARTLEERKRDAKIREGVNAYVSAMRQLGIMPPKKPEKTPK